MRIVSGDEARAAIASHVLGSGSGISAVGEIELHQHQRLGVERIQHLLERHGGALLADDVGLGKTYVALAIARGFRDTLVIAPAALRDTWLAAARRAGVTIRFASVEMLGRGASAGAIEMESGARLVVVDEAHHLRTARTRRFQAAAPLCSGAKVLLLSATPIQNRLLDLRTILSLFLGERAHGLEADALAEFVVRRTEGDVPRTSSFDLPHVREPEWVHVADDVDCLDRLVALPPPLPPSDGHDGGALLTYTLVRQWASSRAALEGALRRRLARARAMEDALSAGRIPSRAELSAWSFADGVQQLSFIELMVELRTPHAARLLDQVRRHADGVRDLLAFLGHPQGTGPDGARAHALLRVLLAHPAERVIAFSEYADTVTALFRLLAPAARVAMLTHGGGRVAGGALTRADVLRRFASGASARVPESERIDLLLSTDVLSEGVDLQDASVVVHLDLSWNPARLAQRVGRLRRPGAARETIAVYLFAPPAATERLLQIERRLRAKLGVAARSLGVAGAILPVESDATAVSAPTLSVERIQATLRAWCRADSAAQNELVIATVLAPRPGAVACVLRGDDVSLVACLEGMITEDQTAVAALFEGASGETLPTDEEAARTLVNRVERWLRQRSDSRIVDLPSLHVAGARRLLLRRVDTIARRTPRHIQPRLAPLMRAARTAATATLSAGAEQVLETLAAAPLADEAWLHAVGEFSALHAPSRAADSQIVALLLLRRTDDVSGSRSR